MKLSWYKPKLQCCNFRKFKVIPIETIKKAAKKCPQKETRMRFQNFTTKNQLSKKEDSGHVWWPHLLFQYPRKLRQLQTEPRKTLTQIILQGERVKAFPIDQIKCSEWCVTCHTHSLACTKMSWVTMPEFIYHKDVSDTCHISHPNQKKKRHPNFKATESHFLILSSCVSTLSFLIPSVHPGHIHSSLPPWSFLTTMGGKQSISLNRFWFGVICGKILVLSPTRKVMNQERAKKCREPLR